MQINGVIRRADCLRCDLACVTGAGQPKQQSSQTLADAAAGRRGRIVEGATRKRRIEREAAGGTVQAGDVLPVLSDIESEFESVTALLLREPRENGVNVVVGDIVAFPAKPCKPRDVDRWKIGYLGLQLSHRGRGKAQLGYVEARLARIVSALKTAVPVTEIEHHCGRDRNHIA